MATVGSTNFAFQKPMGDIMDTMSKFYRVYGGNLHWAPWRTLWGMPSSWLVSEAHVKTLPIHLKMATCECPEVIQCHSVLKGAEYAHCGKFSMKKLRVSSFVHFPIFKGCETGILQLRSRCCQGMAEQPGVERGKMLMGKECNLSNSPIPESLNLGLTRKPYVYNSYSLHFLILWTMQHCLCNTTGTYHAMLQYYIQQIVKA